MVNIKKILSLSLVTTLLLTTVASASTQNNFTAKSYNSSIPLGGPVIDDGGSGVRWSYHKTYSNGIIVCNDPFAEGSFTKGKYIYLPSNLCTSQPMILATLGGLIDISVFAVAGTVALSIMNANRAGGYQGATLFIPHAGAYYYEVRSGKNFQ